MDVATAGSADGDWLAGQFEATRPHLRSVAYGMLGSQAEAEDAVQEAWLRLHRSDASAIEDLRRWLTTVVARISLDMLRSRRARREDYPGTWLPEPVVEETNGPEQQAVMADALGLALLIVLETLSPAERLAFVLHDIFALPFDEIAPVVERTPDAARQLASRARRRVRQAPVPDGDLPRQRRAVDAFLDAAQRGDFEALLDLLDPHVTFRLDTGPAGGIEPIQGAENVARQILATAPTFLPSISRVTVNGGPGTRAGSAEAPNGVAGFTVVGDRIVSIDVIAAPSKLRPARS
ncbi:MAG TPA: RNA polymerase sigma factor SigJ [Frankiaceae bacterium]|nr:RNA polymerase sigma factor SigJ [Frankiaceae bacterium]